MQNRLFNGMTSKKGASSVLVVLVLVVLVVLGLGALTISHASMRLGEKSGDWFVRYYELDKNAERKIALIDRAIMKAHEFSVEYVEEKAFLHENSSISGRLQKIAKKDYDENKGTTDNYELRIGRMAFLYFLSHELQKIEGIEHMALYGIDDIEDNYFISFIPLINFREQREHEKGTAGIKAAVEITGEKEYNRYRIVEWIQYNE